MRMLIVAIAALSFTFACNSSSTVKEAKALKKRMCACKDMKCGALVQKDQVEWLAKKGKNAGKRDKVELAPVLLAYKNCWDALVKKTKTEVTGAPK